MDSELQSGGCLCKKITYKFDKSVISVHHCPVQIVKKPGSGKATILLIPNESLQINELKYYTVTGSAGSNISRAFVQSVAPH